MQKADNPVAKPSAAAPREVMELVARFGQQLDSSKSGHYNEAQLRQEFLNPLYKAIGWDIHEDAMRIGSAVTRLIGDQINIVEGKA